MSRSSISFGSRPTAAERARYLALYQQSGQTQKVFAQQQGLKLTALRQWLYRPGKPTNIARPAFQELLVTPPTAGWAAEISLGQTVTVRLSQPAVASFFHELLERHGQAC
jgi:hypothetical protein